MYMYKYLVLLFDYYSLNILDSSRDLFRTSGCLEYVCNLVKATTSKDILQAGLYTLASAAEANGKDTCIVHVYLVHVHVDKLQCIIIIM